MEPTRTASFDDEMHERLKNSFNKIGESALKAGNEILKLSELIEEKQIADSHDITKSDFGYEN